LACDVFERNAARRRQHLGGLDHVSRLVALAAIRQWREIRCIGLDQHALGGSAEAIARNASEFLKVSMPVNET